MKSALCFQTHIIHQLNSKAYALEGFHLYQVLLGITFMPYLYVFTFGSGSKGKERKE